MRPIIFLDFDGVLNSTAFFEEKRRIDPKTKVWNKLDPEAVGRLNNLVRRTGSEIVISSAWRLFKGTSTSDRLYRVLRHFGYDGPMVTGLTPPFGISDPHRDVVHEGHRGGEILLYLRERFPDRIVPPFVILDDRDDMGSLWHRLIQTDENVGLQDEHVEAAIRLLGMRV